MAYNPPRFSDRQRCGESYLLVHGSTAISYWHSVRPNEVVNTGIRSYAEIIASYVDEGRNAGKIAALTRFSSLEAEKAAVYLSA